jgi:hypothetical protein
LAHSAKIELASVNESIASMQAASESIASTQAASESIASGNQSIVSMTSPCDTSARSAHLDRDEGAHDDSFDNGDNYDSPDNTADGTFTSAASQHATHEQVSSTEGDCSLPGDNALATAMDGLLCCACHKQLSAQHFVARHLASKVHQQAMVQWLAEQASMLNQDNEGEATDGDTSDLDGTALSAAMDQLTLGSPGSDTMDSTADSTAETLDNTSVLEVYSRAVDESLGADSAADQSVPSTLPGLPALMHACKQRTPLSFADAFGGASVLSSACKVGEGSFAEVFAAVIPSAPEAWGAWPATSSACFPQSAAFKVHGGSMRLVA